MNMRSTILDDRATIQVLTPAEQRVLVTLRGALRAALRTLPSACEPLRGALRGALHALDTFLERPDAARQGY